MDNQPHSYRIRLARPDDVPRLREIEDEAGTRFSGLGLIDEEHDVSFPLDDLYRLVGLSQGWVACPDNRPAVGMAIASVREGCVYLEEMDVLPAHGSRGLGGRLLASVCAWAQAHGYPAVTLSTFRDVPWNGPFYRQHGFRDLKPTEWTPGMRVIREAEALQGLRVDARVFMRRDLDGVDTAEPQHGRWPQHLPVGALRVMRLSARYEQTVAFYRDIIGLPVLEAFDDSYGQDGTILGLPGSTVHLEIVRLRGALAPTPGRDQLVFYLPDASAMQRLAARFTSADIHPVPQIDYWEANGAISYLDPDGREVVLVPWIYRPPE